MVVVRHPTLELLIERIGRGLTNSDNGCADLGETAHKVALSRWKEGLDEYNVHGGMLLAPMWAEPVEAPLFDSRRPELPEGLEAHLPHYDG